MKLIKAIEETCDDIYASCVDIETAIKKMRLIGDVLDNEVNEPMITNEVSKTRHKRLYRLYDEAIGNEIEADKLQKALCELLKRQNKLLAHIEREAESIQELELY